MKKQIQSKTRKNTAVMIPFDGKITIDEKGCAMVSQEAYEYLIKSTDFWKDVEKIGTYKLKNENNILQICEELELELDSAAEMLLFLAKSEIYVAMDEELDVEEIKMLKDEFNFSVLGEGFEDEEETKTETDKNSQLDLSEIDEDDEDGEDVAEENKVAENANILSKKELAKMKVSDLQELAEASELSEDEWKKLKKSELINYLIDNLSE